MLYQLTKIFSNIPEPDAFDKNGDGSRGAVLLIKIISRMNQTVCISAVNVVIQMA